MSAVRVRPGVRRRLVLFAVLGVAAVGFTAVRYAGLGDGVLEGSYRVRVDLAEAGGIFPAAEVTYRGVPVGRIGDVVPTRDGIAVDLEIEGRWRIPADARAEVHNRSAVGEQYLDLVPPDADGPFLTEGSVIPRERTRTPLPEQELLSSLDRFVGSVDTEDLGTVVSELGTAFSGRGDELGELLDGSSAFVAQARSHLDETTRLLQHSATVLGTQQDQASSISSFTRSLAELAATVRGRDAELRTVVDDGAGLADELSALLTDLEPVAPGFLGNVAILGDVANRNIDALEQILVALPYNVSSTQVAARNGKAQFSLQLTPTPAACQRGYIPPRQWRSTRDLTVKLPDFTIGCADPKLNPRGSAQVP